MKNNFKKTKKYYLNWLEKTQLRSIFSKNMIFDNFSIWWITKLVDKDNIIDNNFNEYIKDQISLNCIVGRVCGRISNSNFNLNEKQYKLFVNDKPNHIHGGKEGFNTKVWKIESLEETPDCLSCVLKYTSLHMEEG